MKLDNGDYLTLKDLETNSSKWILDQLKQLIPSVLLMEFWILIS